MTDKEAMAMALDALETLMIERGSIYEKAIDALKERSADPMHEVQRLGQEIEQEPPKYSFKAHWEKDGRIGVVGAVVRPDGGVHLLQDFIDPPQRTWVGLTDEDIGDAYVAWDDTDGASFADFARAIEAKLKQKNGYAEEKNT
ncbi:MAG: hypothetical protein RLZZ454_83 [Pseudomonadota bacterium]|jgi:hypothetical protein